MGRVEDAIESVLTPGELSDDDMETIPILGPKREREGRHKRAKPLALLPLVALIFYDVSGGPFGIEDAVSSGGPLLAVLGFCILPLLWSVPEALITAELATAFPENSGYVAWVTAAFGPFWGFQEGFWSWLSGVTDNAVYPVMFLKYLEVLLDNPFSGWHRALLVLAIAGVLTYVNYCGLTIVGNTAVAMTVFIVLPFIVLIGLAFPHIQPHNWVKVDWDSIRWGDYLNIMFWNLNYWDSVSTLAGEVPMAQVLFPRAIGVAVVLVVMTYLLPLLAGLGVMGTVQEWKTGYFTTVAKQVGGPWLGWWIVAAAAASQIGQFEAEMSSDSFLLLGMAERGFLPAALARRSMFDTPLLGILLSSVGVLALSAFDFLKIVQLLNVIYCLAELLEFVAFVVLRYKFPNLHRPYRVPLPNWACGLMLVPASILLMTLLILPIVRRDTTVMIWTGTILLAGLVLYPLLGVARHRGWCEFFEASPDDFAAALKEGYGPPPLVPAVSAEIAEIDEVLAEGGEEDEGLEAGAEAAGASPHRSPRRSPRRSFWSQSPR